jgi:hypothetical protein
MHSSEQEYSASVQPLADPGYAWKQFSVRPNCSSKGGKHTT